MKLTRIGAPGAERPAVLDGDAVWRDGSGVVPDIDAAGLNGDLLARVGAAHEMGDLPLAQDGQRFGPPVAAVGRIVCVGLNHRDHAAETGAAAAVSPFGPWMVTVHEIPDPQQLGLRLWVNGEPKQDGTTKDMLVDVSYLVYYVSQFMTLQPGDVINTGTPAGVALGVDGTPYLTAGDVVELEIDGLGRQRQTCGAA